VVSRVCLPVSRQFESCTRSCFFTAKLAATPVYVPRREFRLSAFSRFLAFPQGFAPMPEGCVALSVSRDADRGADPTIEVGLGPRNPGPKLSESLINNPSWVSNAVGFYGRDQPARRSTTSRR
jgi:hypothetical protein